MNKKKFISLLVAIALSLTVLAGCGGDKDSSSDSGSSSSTATAKSSFDADAVTKGVEVESYTYQVYSSHYLVLVFKNTKADCELNVSVDFLDSKGEVVGAKQGHINAFAKGSEVALTFYSDQKFAKFDYNLEAKEIGEYYAPVAQDLSCEAKVVKNKVIVSVTNNGKVPAKFVEYTPIFFKGDKVVYSSHGYATDSNNEIKPGKTIRKESSCYETFDSVKVYVDGRAEVK